MGPRKTDSAPWPRTSEPPKLSIEQKETQGKRKWKVSLAHENKRKGAKKEKEWKPAPLFPPQSPNEPML